MSEASRRENGIGHVIGMEIDLVIPHVTVTPLRAMIQMIQCSMNWLVYRCPSLRNGSLLFGSYIILNSLFILFLTQ